MLSSWVKHNDSENRSANILEGRKHEEPQQLCAIVLGYFFLKWVKVIYKIGIVIFIDYCISINQITLLQ